MLGILGTPIKSCQKLSQNQRSFLILPGYRKLCFHTSPQVKEKIPETWERLSYLMDHNEERSADPGLWGTYRWLAYILQISGDTLTFALRESVNSLLQSADPNLSDEDIDRAVGLLWVNAFACSNGGGQVIIWPPYNDHMICPTFSFMLHSCTPIIVIVVVVVIVVIILSGNLPNIFLHVALLHTHNYHSCSSRHSPHHRHRNHHHLLRQSSQHSPSCRTLALPTALTLSFPTRHSRCR